MIKPFKSSLALVLALSFLNWTWAPVAYASDEKALSHGNAIANNGARSEGFPAEEVEASNGSMDAMVEMKNMINEIIGILPDPHKKKTEFPVNNVIKNRTMEPVNETMPGHPPVNMPQTPSNPIHDAPGVPMPSMGEPMDSKPMQDKPMDKPMDSGPMSMSECMECDLLDALVDPAQATVVIQGIQRTSDLIFTAADFVYVGAGATLIVDSQIEVDKLVVDGLVKFATNVNTRVRADSIVVRETGSFYIGEPGDPVQLGVTARLEFTDKRVNADGKDPFQLLHGFISYTRYGRVYMEGAYVTPRVDLTVGPTRGATVLTLATIPVNWKVGDQLVLASANQDPNQNEYRKIVAIQGTTVTLDAALTYDHVLPPGFGATFSIENLTRTIQISSINPFVTLNRGHFMLTGEKADDAPADMIINISVSGLGRTTADPLDGAKPGSDGQFTEGNNQAGRYGWHAHMKGNKGNPTVLQGSVVLGLTQAPDGSILNMKAAVTVHESEAIVNGNTIGGYANGVFIEGSNETGSVSDNFVFATPFPPSNLRPDSRINTNDFGGTNTTGFWIQSPLMSVENNVAWGGQFGYVIFTKALPGARIAVSDLDPALLARLNLRPGARFVSPQVIPTNIQGNLAVFTDTGLESWFATLEVRDFTALGVIRGISIEQTTGATDVQGALLVGRDPANPQGIAVKLNPTYSSSTYFSDVTAMDFAIGANTLSHGVTEYVDFNLKNIKVHFTVSDTNEKASKRVVIENLITDTGTPVINVARRSLSLTGTVSALNAPSDVTYIKDGVEYAVFSLDQIGSYVFPKRSGYPAEIFDGTHTAAEVYAKYGIAANGRLAPDSAVLLNPNGNAYIAPKSDVAPLNPWTFVIGFKPGALRYYVNTPSFTLDFQNVLNGQIVRGVVVTLPAGGEDGWNFYTAEFTAPDGQTVKVSGFVYYDTTPPTGFLTSDGLSITEMKTIPEAQVLAALNGKAMLKQIAIPGRLIDPPFAMSNSTKALLTNLVYDAATKTLQTTLVIRDLAGNIMQQQQMSIQVV